LQCRRTLSLVVPGVLLSDGLEICASLIQTNNDRHPDRQTDICARQTPRSGVSELPHRMSHFNEARFFLNFAVVIICILYHLHMRGSDITSISGEPENNLRVRVLETTKGSVWRTLWLAMVL
jgi:hypothetical protein